MSTLYQLLGVQPGATEQELKAAFRSLARRFHPDVNGDDPTTAQRFKEVSDAYRTLSDPASRSAYDRALVCQEKSDKNRFLSLAATAIATFILTTAIVFIAVLWSRQSGSIEVVRSQPLEAGNGHETNNGRRLLISGPKALAGYVPQVDSTPVRTRGWSWITYRNNRFRFSLKYPADIFAFGEGQASDNGVTLTSADGEAVLNIFAAKNITGTTVGRYRRMLVNNRYADVKLDHTLQGRTWFVLSGAKGDKVFYEHVAFSCDGRSIHGWQMTYPLSARTFYDLVADEVHRNSLSSASCGRPKKQSRKTASSSRSHRR